MKKFFALGWMLVAALTLTHCSKDEVTGPEMGGGESFAFYANTGDSRTTMEDLKTTWSAEDAMNVWTAATDGYTSHGKFELTDAEGGKFEGTLAAELGTANDWYVMYPYNANITSPDGKNYMYVGHSSPKQNGNNSQAHLSDSAAPLYGIATNVAASEAPHFQMHHLSTFVRVRLTNSTAAPFSVATVHLTSNSGVYIAGSYYVDITATPINYKASGDPYTKKEVTLTVNNGEEIAVGDNAEFYLPLAPIDFSAEETLILTIKTTDGATITVEKTIPANTEFAAGEMNTLKAEATAANTEYPTVTLPALDKTKYYYYKKVTEFTVGKWYLLAGTSTTAATAIPSDKSYGYPAVTEFLPIGDVVAAPAACAFGFLPAGEAYSIQQYDSRYVCMGTKSDGTPYNSFQIESSAKNTWTVEAQSDGSMKISNTELSGYYIQYSTTHNSFGIYNTVSGNIPVLYELTEVVDTPLLLGISTESLSFVADGGSKDVTVDIYGEGEVTASANQTWVKANVSGTTVTVTAEANEGNAREAVVTISFGNMSKTVTVSQAAKATGDVVLVEDILTADLFKATNTTYADFSGVTVTSKAVYAGNNSKTANGGIQLRSKNSNSGIVTTTSGGKARKVKVVWESGTTSGRTLQVFGSNTAYTAASDLYDTNKKGTQLGTIVMGTSTELEITGDYDYIGLRSASGAMYLASITITYEE